MWTDYFDKIFLINLAHREDRLHSATLELAKYDIDFILQPAIRHINGSRGLWMTMMEIFNAAIASTWKRILVFEDDILFVRDPNRYMPDVIQQLPLLPPRNGEGPGLKWDMLHLGPNTHAPLQQVEDNLLRMSHCRSTHAVAYSYQCMYTLTQKMKNWPMPLTGGHIDVFYELNIQPKGNCYCTYPLLCTQKSDYSDIAGEVMDQSYIETRFLENTKHLM